MRTRYTAILEHSRRSLCSAASRGRSASANALLSQVASSLTNALFSGLALSQLPLDEAGLLGILWSIYFLTIAFAKGATVFNGAWQARAWSPWSSDLLALLVLPGGGGGLVLAAAGYGTLGLACMVLGPALVLIEIVRQESLVADGALAVRLDLVWLLFCAAGFAGIWLSGSWHLDALFLAWAGSALGALTLVYPQVAAKRPGISRLAGLAGAEHLVAGASLSLVVLMTGAKFGLAAVATVRLLQLATTPLRLVQAAAQPLLYGQHQRSRPEGHRPLRYRQAVGLGVISTVLLLAAAIALRLWPVITSRNDLSVPWPVFAWYGLIILANTALMPTVAMLRSLRQTGPLLRWRLGLLATSVACFGIAPNLTLALAGLAVGTLLSASLLARAVCPAA